MPVYFFLYFKLKFYSGCGGCQGKKSLSELSSITHGRSLTSACVNKRNERAGNGGRMSLEFNNRLWIKMSAKKNNGMDSVCPTDFEQHIFKSLHK